MIEEQRYCVDILQQIKAIKSALRALELNIVDGHLNHCVYKAVKSKSRTEAQEIIDEIKDLLRQSAK